MLVLETTRVDVIVLCVFCDEPLDHGVDELWCPDCDQAEAELRVGPQVGPD